MIIIDVVKKYKWKILLIYFYVLCAQILFLIEPFILGKTIDGILKQEFDFLIILFMIHLFENFFMYKRMVYDTKIYLSVYNEVVFDYLKRDNESDTSTRIARTELANNLVNFVENDLNYFIMSVITIIGTLFFIFSISWKTGLVMLSSVIPIILIVKIFYRKIEKCTRIGNNHYENKFAIIDTWNDSLINTFFKRRKKLLIFGSTLQGKHWASLNLNKSTFLVLSIVIFTMNSENLSHGGAVAMFAYLNQFLISLMSIPVGVETFTRIKDILKRIE